MVLEYPICMAKTQYSFSTDPLLMGAPSGHDVPIREVRLSAGAEFVARCMWRDRDNAWFCLESQLLKQLV